LKSYRQSRLLAITFSMLARRRRDILRSGAVSSKTVHHKSS